MKERVEKGKGNGKRLGLIPADVRLHDESAERSILGLLLASPEHLPRVRTVLTGEDFYFEEHRLLFQVVEKLFEEHGVSWDEVVLRDRIKKEGLEERLPFDWILGIYEEACPEVALDTACRIIKDYSVQRRCFDLVTRWFYPSLKNGSFSLPEFINRLSKILVETSVIDSESALSLIHNLLEKMSRREEENTEKSIYSTGYASIETVLDGLPLGAYVLVGARPRVGKTSFGLNLALSIHRQGRAEPPPVLFVSLEMSELELMKRLVSIISGVPYSVVKNESLTKEQVDGIAEACVAEMEKLRRFYVIHKPGMEVYELEGQIVRHRVEHGVEVVIVDYVQLLRFRGEMGVSYEPLSQITQYLSTIARKHGVLLIGLVQVGRDAEKRADKRPTLGDLKGSGQMEQDADVVLLLHREGLYKKNPKEEDLRKLEVIVAKNRFGRVGTVTLSFDGSTQRIEDAGVVRSIEGITQGGEADDINEGEEYEDDYDLDF